MGEAETDWRQADDYYWAGAPGWTICRVWVGGAYRYELWHTRDGVGCLVGSRVSFALRRGGSINLAISVRPQLWCVGQVGSARPRM